MDEGHRDIGVLLYAHMNAGKHSSPVCTLDSAVVVTSAMLWCIANHMIISQLRSLFMGIPRICNLFLKILFMGAFIYQMSRLVVVVVVFIESCGRQTTLLVTGELLVM